MYAIKYLFGILVWMLQIDFGKYLDYKNCKSKKRLADKLAEESTENIEEAKQ